MVQSRTRRTEARFDSLEARMEELFKTVQDYHQRLNSRLDALENRRTTRTEKGSPRDRYSPYFGRPIPNTAEQWGNLDLQLKPSNLEKTVPAEEADASNSAADTTHLHRDSDVEDDVSQSEKGEEQGFLESATAEIRLGSGASREEHGTRGSVTGGKKPQNAIARYGGGDRRAYGLGRPCSIVARPPPLLAAVLPWDRKDERQSLEVDGVTMSVENEILGQRNMLRRAANDEAERREAAAVSGFSQTNGVQPGFLLKGGRICCSAPMGECGGNKWLVEEGEGTTINAALIFLGWSGPPRVIEAQIFGLIVGPSGCNFSFTDSNITQAGPNTIFLDFKEWAKILSMGS